MALRQPLKEIGLPQKTQGASDPRWMRSRKALAEAALSLAQEQAISSVSVNALTKRAEVNRATFYNHAESPQALLSSVLREELDEIFDIFHLRLLDSHGYLSKVQDYGIRSIVEHVKKHQCIYRNSLAGENNSLLHSVLAQYLIEKSLVLMSESQYRFSSAQPSNDFEKTFAVRAACAALVGGITTWLNDFDDPQVDDFMRAYYVSFPAWFTMTGPAYD
jgi:AcrR family transcriptional regulator